MSRTSPSPYTPWLVSMRMITHGLGPGFTTTAYRMSVIFRLDGLDAVFTFWIAGPASANCPAMPPASTASDDLRT